MTNAEGRLQNAGESRNAAHGARRLGGGADIRERTFEFAVRISRLVDALPKTVSGAVIARQLARSGTSIGANIEEAEAAHSKAEFARRMNIARAEARETHYWLRLIAARELVSAGKLSKIVAESDEIIRILTAIVRNSRK